MRKRVLAFVAVFFVMLAVFALPAAAVNSQIGDNYGYLSYAEIKVTYHNVRYILTNELISNAVVGYSEVVGGDSLFTDSFYMSTENYAVLKSVGEFCADCYRGGAAFEYATVEFIFSSPVPLSGFRVYTTGQDIQINSVDYMLDNWMILISEPGADTSHYEPMQSRGDVKTIFSNGYPKYYNGYLCHGFKFTVNPPLLDSNQRMDTLAGYFYEYSDGSTRSDLFSIYADNGSLAFLAPSMQSSIDVARQEGFDKGYASGVITQQKTSYDSGYRVGYNAGYDLGVVDGGEAAIDANQQIWIDVGYRDGYNAGVAASDTDLDVSFKTLFLSVCEAPVTVIVNALDFDFLGYNMATFAKAVFTMLIVFTIGGIILKKVI